MRKVALGRHIVVDPKVCHGRPTIAGTRIFVSDILEQVAAGMDWDAIVAEWRGAVTREAIAESVRLASNVLRAHQADLLVDAKGR